MPRSWSAGTALFDTSGGAGVLPQEWPVPAKDFWCGYAGGLGPFNVIEQVRKIETVCAKPFWIDMERRHMQSIRAVLAAVHRYRLEVAENVEPPKGKGKSLVGLTIPPRGFLGC
jgi:hypothetical protein